MAQVLSLVLVADADRAVGRIGIFVLSRDAARRIAASIAKLASLAAATKTPFGMSTLTRANVQPPNNPWHMATSALTVCTRSNPLEEVCFDADQQVFADVMYLMGCTKREVSLSNSRRGIP